MDTTKNFGKHIRALQNSRGLNVTEAAIQADMNYDVYSKAVNGNGVTIKNAVRIVNFYGTTMNHCLYDTEDTPLSDDMSSALNLFDEKDLKFLLDVLVKYKTNGGV